MYLCVCSLGLIQSVVECEFACLSFAVMNCVDVGQLLFLSGSGSVAALKGNSAAMLVSYCIVFTRVSTLVLRQHLVPVIVMYFH